MELNAALSNSFNKFTTLILNNFSGPGLITITGARGGRRLILGEGCSPKEVGWDHLPSKRRLKLRVRGLSPYRRWYMQMAH